MDTVIFVVFVALFVLVIGIIIYVFVIKGDEWSDPEKREALKKFDEHFTRAHFFLISRSYEGILSAIDELTLAMSMNFRREDISIAIEHLRTAEASYLKMRSGLLSRDKYSKEHSLREEAFLSAERILEDVNFSLRALCPGFGWFQEYELYDDWWSRLNN